MREEADVCVGAIYLSFTLSSLDFEINQRKDFRLG
jgi:hypothetical protein